MPGWKHSADKDELKKGKYRGSSPGAVFAVSACGEIDPDVHGLMNELAMRWVENM